MMWPSGGVRAQETTCEQPINAYRQTVLLFGRGECGVVQIVI